MASFAPSDPWIDHPRTPKNGALVLVQQAPHEEFVAAVRATGRKKLIFAALWAEVCLAFPVVGALSEADEIYVPVDCVAGTSTQTHRAGLDRVVRAGAVPVSWISIL